MGTFNYAILYIASTMIKPLTIDDFDIWKAARLEAVRLHPDSFGESLADVEKQNKSYFAKSLETATILAYFVGDEIAGMIGCFRFTPHNAQHKGVIFGMYVKEKYRRQSIAAQLLDAIEKHAKANFNLVQLQLHVTTQNQKAFPLYKKRGYSVYGTEPKSLLINGKFYDDYLMAKLL
jgi:ribosomal protein S18 acetylase RimI-like enzyme